MKKEEPLSQSDVKSDFKVERQKTLKEDRSRRKKQESENPSASSVSEEEAKIPNYDHIFDEELPKSKRKKGILRKFAKANAKPIIISTIVYFFQALPVWVIPICTSNLINIVTAIVESGFESQLMWYFAINVIVAVVSLFLNVPFTVLRWRIVSKMLRRTSAGLKSAVVRKLQHLSITYHKDMQSGKIQAKFLRDVESVDGLFHAIMFSFIPAIISVVVSSTISIYKNIYVSLFFLVVIPCNVWLTFAFRKKIRQTNKDFRVKTEDMSAQLTTMMEMTPVTKSHGLQSKEIATLNKSIARVTVSGYGVDRVNAYFGSWSYVIQNVLNLLCLVFCCFLAFNKVISVGEIVLYQSMFTSISGGISGLVGFAPTMGKGLDALSSISEIMTATEVENTFGKLKVDKISGDVEFKDVSYHYPGGKTDVIKDFSLKVERGKCVAFVGSSGSGKSTIMNLVIGLLTPTEGEIFIDGKPMKELDLINYRQNISVVPQNSILFSGTIRENITYGLEGYSEELLNKVVEMANINEFLKDFPDGLDTQVGEHGDKLSGGQKQRITIARALIRDPKILILDEATSALDNISEYHVQKAISASISGRTTFIVAHRLSTIRNADLIVVIENGKCVESGSYEELMDKKGKFYDLKSLSDINSKLAEDALS